MIYYSDNKFNFYSNKVQFTSSLDGKQSAYCNNIQDYLDMVKQYPWQFSNLTHEQVLPSAEQQSRLELLNNLEVQHKNTYENECVLFVEYGAIPSTTKSQFLLDIAEDYLDETANYLALLKNNKWEEIKQKRSWLTLNGGYKVGTKWFHSDTVSRSQQLGLVMLGNNIPSGLQWKTMDGTFVEMTPALAQQVFQAATLQDAALFTYAETLNSQVHSAETPEEILSIDVENGWPETYTEGE